MLLQRLNDNGLWSSLKELELVRQKLNQMMSAQNSGTEYPSLNVWVSENGAIVEAEIPGLEIDDLDLSVLNDILVIKGERRPDELAEGEKYHRQERGCGRFARNIQLPFNIDADNISATLEHGVLEISLPRAQADRPKKITLKNE